MSTVVASFRALLESEEFHQHEAEFSDSVEDRQGRLCQELTDRLLSYLNESSPRRGGESSDFSESPRPTIRQVFRDATSAQLSTLATPILSNLLTHRVDREALLPMTQDAAANEEALSSLAALTLTRPSILAAELYARLLGLPGAVGSGLVKLEALSALSALIRRWNVECCGRESLLLQDMPDDFSSISNSRNETSPTKSPPKKICRRRGPKRMVTLDDSDDEGDENNDSSPSESSPVEALRSGFQVASALCHVICQREFPSWSPEAREALLDAVVSCFATCAALKDHPSAAPAARIKLQGIVQHASRSLQECLESCSSKPQRHASSVVILRGLYPLLSLKDTLPNGERGKQAAHAAAVDAMEGMILSASEAMTQKRDVSSFQTPSRRKGRRNSTDAGAANTPTPLSAIQPQSMSVQKSQRKKRVSFDGRTPSMTTPVVKGRVSGAFSTPSTPGILQPRPILTAFLGLLQKLATGDLERASVRIPTVNALHNCMQSLPHLERSHFLRYLLKLVRSKISVHRLVGCELIGKVLEKDWVRTDHHQDPAVLPSGTTPTNLTPPSEESNMTPGIVSESNTTLPIALWVALQGRLVDRIAAVRARAAFSIESVLFQKTLPGGATDTTLTTLRLRASKDETATVRKAAVGAMTQLLLVKPEWLSERDIVALSELTHDPSTLTRKAAAEALTTLLDEWLVNDSSETSDEDRLEWLKNLLEEAWSTCVLPLVMDIETGCSSKAVVLFDRVVVGPILQEKHRKEDNQAVHGEDARRELVAWRILANVGIRSSQQGASKGEVKALQVALKQVAVGDWSRVHVRLLERISRVCYHTLPDKPDTSNEESNSRAEDLEKREAQFVGVWCLFDALIAGQPKEIGLITETLQDSAEGLEFVCKAWETMLARLSQDPSTTSTLRGVLLSSLSVLSNLSLGLDTSRAQECAVNLKRFLEEFALPPGIIGAAVDALASVTVASFQEPTPDLVRKQCAVWIRQLFGSCEEKIASFVQAVGQNNAELSQEGQSTLARALVTVGSLTMVGFRPDDDTSMRDSKATSGTQDSSGHSSTSSEFLRRLNERPSRRLKELVLALLSNRIPGPENISTPATIRAHAFTVLGKLCLRDELLAKESLNLLARELHPSTLQSQDNAAVQSNALLVLGDLCVRYTNMADRYLPIMAACLQAGCSDPDTNLLNPSDTDSSIVRKHAVLLLSSLLLQDYIKWRGLLFHRFLVASSDEDEGVAHLAETVLCGPLFLRQPKLFFNNFVESLFVLNRCTAHPIYVAAATMGDGGSGIAVGFEGIHLTGAVGEDRRRRMYLLMLSKMTDEEKIGVTARLAKVVLGSALDSDSDLGRVCKRSAAQSAVAGKSDSAAFESAWNVMSDAFFILKSKALKVGSKGHQLDDGSGVGDIEDPNMASNPARQVSAAKNRLLSKISSKHLIETILPILSNLKSLLQSSCSPLLKDLMTYMLEIYKSYKTEVREFLANDITLLQEIEYDLRQQNGARRSTPAVAGAATPGTPDSPSERREDDDDE